MNKNLKDFNLERALAGDPVVTRDGRKVQDIKHFDKCALVYPVICIIEEGEIYTHAKNGKHYTDYESVSDLFMAPIEKEYWMASGKGINTYNKDILCIRLCETEEEARRVILGTGLIKETVQYHKITRLE